MNKPGLLKNFIKYYLYKLNHGVPYTYSPITPEEWAEINMGAGEYRPKWKLNLLLFIITFFYHNTLCACIRRYIRRSPSQRTPLLCNTDGNSLNP